MFELVESRLYAYADDSTLIAAVRKPAEWPAVAASINFDFTRIQEWYNQQCMILNRNKTYISGNLCDVLLLSCISSPNLWLLFSGVGVSCWRLPLASRAPSVFGGHAVLWSQVLVILCHRRHVAGLSMLYKVNSNSNHCLFSDLPSASTRVWHSRAAAVAHPLKFEVSRCRTS